MSKRLDILNAIKTKIDLIKRQDGYNNDVIDSSISYIPISRIKSYATVCLLPLESIYIPKTNYGYTTGSNAVSIDGWPIVIVGYCKTGIGEGNLTEAMENLVEDILKVLFIDHTLGLSYVMNCYLVAIDHAADLKTQIGTVYVTVAVKYDFDKVSP